MTFINTVFQRIFKKRLHEIEQFAKYPSEIQEGQLKILLRVSQNTDWGKKFNFHSVKSIEDYQKKVPLQKYEEARIQIDRIRKGEQNVLWPEGYQLVCQIIRNY